MPVHLKGEDGTWAPSEIELNQEPEYWAGGHGLYSTPRDFLKFQRALLGGGEFDGTRILQQSTVEAAFQNQIGDLDFPASIPTADPATSFGFNVGPGYKWGYGLLLNTNDVPGARRAGSGAWAGLLNTPLLGRSGQRHHGCDLHPVPPVRPRRGNEDVRRLREGSVRLALS